MSSGQPYLIIGLLLAGSVAASMAAARLRVPALLLFLAVGMAAGSDGAGWFAFDSYTTACEVGSVLLALILFDGGLSAGYTQIRRELAASLRLAVVATVLVAVITAVAAAALFRMPPLPALLLGAILASTDSAAVFGLLRQSTLRPRLRLTLEGEAGFNDPVSLVMVLGFIQWSTAPDYGLTKLLLSGVRELTIGALCGLLVAKLALAAFRRLRLPSRGLYPVASVAVAAFVYGLSASLGGSAFLAVYLTGLLLGDATLPGRQTVAAFHDGAAWVAQVGVFLMLGLLAAPSRMGAAAAEGLVIGLIVVVVARPIATLIATAGLRFSLSERAILSWSGLRGAAPIVFATYPVAEHVRGGRAIFDVVLFAVIVSTLLQGLTFEWFARRLGLTVQEAPLPRPLAEFGGPRALGVEVIEYPVSAYDGVVGRRVLDMALPEGSSVMMVVRDGEALNPAPPTRLYAGDVLHLLVRQETVSLLPQLLERLRDPLAGRVVTFRRTPPRGRGR